MNIQVLDWVEGGFEVEIQQTPLVPDSLGDWLNQETKPISPNSGGNTPFIELRANNTITTGTNPNTPNWENAPEAFLCRD